MTKWRPGQVLVEMMIALGIAVLGLLSLVIVSNKSIANSGFSKRQAQANGYTTQILEYVRSQKEVLGWIQFKSQYGSGNYCYNGTGITAGSNCQLSGTEFRNTITISYGRITPPAEGIDQMAVEVVVNWNDSGAIRSSKQKTEYTRY